MQGTKMEIFYDLKMKLKSFFMYFLLIISRKTKLLKLLPFSQKNAKLSQGWKFPAFKKLYWLPFKTWIYEIRKNKLYSSRASRKIDLKINLLTEAREFFFVVDKIESSSMLLIAAGRNRWSAVDVAKIFWVDVVV